MSPSMVCANITLLFHLQGLLHALDCTAAPCVISSSQCLKMAGLTPFVPAVSLGVARLKQDKR